MNFISFGFLVFFIFVSAFYYLAGFRARPALLLLASYFFYSGFGAGFTLLLFAVTVATYAFSLFVNNLKRDFWGKSAFVLSVAASLSPLLFFKYFDFLCRSFSDTFLRMGLELGTATLNLIVPVGISFYSFRVVSYLADVYSGKTVATRSFVKYALYVSYFPQIISGPIERAENFFAQVGRRVEYDPRNLAEGSKLIIFGLFKKLVIADSLAAYVDNVYAAAGAQPGLNLAVAAVFFSIQLYCDFSGYTDIATGLSKCLGYDMAKNFDRPYFSRNIKEFWARWHISLSTWLRDYIYIPLGGSRCSKLRKYSNIMATFAISGLWHGANWTFVIWGMMHGAFLVIHDIFSGGKSGGRSGFAVSALCIVITFAAVTAAWIVFRADSFSHAYEIFRGIATRLSFSYASLSGAALPFTNDNTSIAYFLAALFFIGVLFANSLSKTFGVPPRLGKYVNCYYAFLLACIMCFGQFDGGNFIYAQF